jgi:5-dehydro-2-deoxygluconokinase
MTETTVTPYDLVSMGRIGVDLYPEQIGVPLEHVRTFRKMLGGSATNVAVAAARNGRRAAVITRVGDDGFGRFCREAVAAFGIDDRYVGVHPALRTPLAFCEIHPPDDFPLLFYREPRAPDLELTVDELDRGAIETARVLWTTGTGLSVEPSRTTTLTAMSWRSADAITIHDLDHRPMFWGSIEEARDFGREAVSLATVAVGNRQEASVVVGEGEPRELAGRLLDLGVGLAIVKLGPLGVLAMTRDEEVVVPPIPVDVVNGLGAGDAFGGALVHGLLAGWPVERTVRYANAAGALVAGRLGCADDMPLAAEIEQLLADADAAASR